MRISLYLASTIKDAGQDTASLRVPSIAWEPKALFVNESADETPQGWYCVVDPRRTTHAHVHVPLCPIFPCQDRNRFLDSHHIGQSHARPVSEKPEPYPHSVTSDRKALRTQGQHPWSSCHHYFPSVRIVSSRCCTNPDCEGPPRKFDDGDTPCCEIVTPLPKLNLLEDTTRR